MSKQPASDTETPDLPPPYAELTTSSSSTNLTSPIQSHLSALPSRLRAAQANHASSQSARDLAFAALAAPHVERFLSALGSQPPPAGGALVAELVLVPAAPVSGWTLSGLEERRKAGEKVAVARVAVDDFGGGVAGASKGSRSNFNESSPRQQAEDDVWGGGFEDSHPSREEELGCAWWTDEGQARRVADCLQPKEPARLDRRHVAATVAATKDSTRAWPWGRKKSETAATSPQIQTESSSKGATEQVQSHDSDNVRMKVRVEEVTFRRENEMELWESTSGFGIIVNVRITRVR